MKNCLSKSEYYYYCSFAGYDIGKVNSGFAEKGSDIAYKV
jgi:hypothetical protein